MYRYFGLIWNPANPRQSDAAMRLRRALESHVPELRSIVDAPGLRVCHAGHGPRVNRAYVLPGNAGAIVGVLFFRARDGRAACDDLTLSESEQRRIVASGGRRLIDNYWGRYVAFVRDESARASYVLRDPTGSLPCFTTNFQGVDIYFSRMQDCLALGVLKFTINWRYIAGHVPLRLLQVNRTGLNEVMEIQPGECAEISTDAKRAMLYWDPVRISETNVIENPAEAARALRDSALACVGAWSSRYDSIIHTLSGGLDSSIVLACLHRAPAQPRIACVNYFTPSTEGDERAFARLVASRVKCELIEEQRNASEVRLDAVRGIVKSAKPWLYGYYLEHGQFESRIARERGACAIFGGGGGDGLFFQARAGYGVTDYVRRHGVRRDLFRLALDTAYLERKSVWAVLRNALNEGLIKRRWTPYATLDSTQTLVDAEVLRAAESEDFVHPWLKTAALMPPGKLWQILSISIPSIYYDPFGSDDRPERVHPLVSQPLIEVCLRIPTYVLTTGGWDRSIARRAFAEDLPPEIVTRRTKGGINEHTRSIFEQNLEFLREFLLDGLLVKRRFLNRVRLEACLSGRDSMGRAFAEIDDHVSTEAWLRSWSQTESRAAA